jgi:hypothetical protein
MIALYHIIAKYCIELFETVCPQSLIIPKKIYRTNRDLTANLTGIPAHLRGREFIYRNANSLHVKEFQELVRNHLMVSP